MAAKIFLCRHGQDEDNANSLLNGHRDRPLTALGREQAEQVTERIQSKSIDIIYTSPLQRARVTAETIAQPFGIRPTILDELIERDFGVLTGRPYEAIYDFANGHILQTEKVTYFLDCDGVESFPQCLARAHKVLARVDQECKGKNVLLVAHGDMGKMLIAARRKMHWSDALCMQYIANTEVIQL